MADGKVVIDTSLDNRGFTRGVRNLKNDMGGLEAVAKKVGRTLAVVFSAKAIFDFGKACVELGSNIAEVQNVVDVSFGDMAYKIEEFAKTSIQNFGMSKLSAKKTASTYMAMARGMGMAEGQASDMAIALTGLSGDVASFFNISQELADIKLKSVFTGETETLKDLGVVMTQANLKAYAMSKGINKNIESMTQAEQVSLRYNFVMDQLKLAHGDFARTSDSWANQTRILSEQWKEFMSILGQMIITVLTPLVKTLNAIATSMIDAANAANSFMVSLFGGTKTQMQQTQDQADQVGGAIEGSVEGQGDLTEEVKNTNKEAKKSLLTFDELNKITENTAAGVAPSDGPETGIGGSIGTEVGEELEKGLSEQMQGLVESLKQVFGELKQWFLDFWEPFSLSWDANGGEVMASAKFALTELVNLVKVLGTSFMEVWSNGTGVIILNTIYSIVSNILAIIGTLAQKLREAWEANGNGVAIWQSVLNIIQLVLNFIDRVVAATLNWAQGINFEPIVSAFRGLLEAITPVIEIILDDLAWSYENILLPLATWVIEAAGPAAVDALSAAFRVLSEYMEACSETWRWMQETFLKPLADWIGDIILSALHWLADALNNLADWMRDNQDKVQDFTIVVGSLATAFLAVVSALKIFNAAKALLTAFNAALMALTSPVGLVVVAIGTLIAIVVLLVKHWDEVKAGAQQAWEGICNTWNAAGEWITKNVLDPIVNGFKSAINFILGLVEGFVNFFISGINGIIDGLNSLSFDVPDWVPLIGGNTFGFNISNVPELSIPRLATGAVIPPNNEFLAVLGDQKRGTNIEAPAGLIRQIVREELGRNGGNGVQRIELVVKPEPGFTRYMSYELDEANQNRGVKLVKGAVMG